VKRDVVLVNQWGLHARSAFSLASTARLFKSDIRFEKNGDFADCKEVSELLTLCAACGDKITIRAEGPDSDKALEKLVKLVESGFGEDK